MEKEKIYKQLMWDYNISPEEIDKLIKGETKYAGHYTMEGLFVKMLNNLTWYEIIEIFSFEIACKLLTDNAIKKIRIKSLQQRYEKLKRILRNETLSSSGWYIKSNEQTAYPILSDRWYGD